MEIRLRSWGLEVPAWRIEVGVWTRSESVGHGSII